MIQSISWSPGQSCVEKSSEIPPLRDDLMVWIDMEAATDEEIATVFKDYFPIHALTLEDVTRPQRYPEQGAHLPKVEEFQDYLFVIANPLPVADEKGQRHYVAKSRPQLSAILHHNLLITHHDLKLDCIENTKKYTERHEGCLGRGPDFLFHLILDDMVDEYAPVVEKLASRLDRIENRIFRQPERNNLIHLLKLKRQLSFMRKTMILEREVLSRLTRSEFTFVDDREIVYYRNVYDHLVRYTELIENGREMVSDLMQTHLAATSHRLNEVMKLLTMFSAILLPMSLVAGIYGMNFEKLPEVKWEYGYFWALGVMLTIALSGFAFFRWKKWL